MMKMSKQATIRSKYVRKVDTIALLLLGGVDPKKLRIEYPDITDEDIRKAEEKLEKLGLKGGDKHG